MSAASRHQGGWDVHAHIVPPGVMAAAERGAFGMVSTPEALRVCGHGVPVHPISNVGLLLDRVQADALDGAIVSIPPPLFRPDLSDAQRRDYVDLANTSLLDACHAQARALRPYAYLPAEDPELAARVASDLDHMWAGVVMGTELGDVTYSSPRFDPLWQTLSERHLPLFIHPGSHPDRRLDSFYLGNLLGNPVETTVAAAHLIFGRVLERYPDLTVILAHGGGCIAALCGRWQRGVETHRPGVPDLTAPPMEVVRRFYVDSILHSPSALAAVVAVVGDDRILVGSDWPFPMGNPSADHGLEQLDPATRHRIRKLNAEAAFGTRLTLCQH
jgi:aminocarboxymuconate-semialdehyde decarboxylase